MSGKLLESFLGAVAAMVGVWVALELRNPYSDLRLGLAEALDHLKGATP